MCWICRSIWWKLISRIFDLSLWNTVYLLIYVGSSLNNILKFSVMYMCEVWKLLSHVRLFATQWTIHSLWNSPGQNTGVGSGSLFQGIFPTQGLNPGLLHCRQILYQLTHHGSLFSNNSSIFFVWFIPEYFIFFVFKKFDILYIKV